MKGQTGPGQKHLYSRASYLYQAATYLASIEGHPATNIQTLGAQKHIEQAASSSSNVEAGSEDRPMEQRDSMRQALSTTSSEQAPLSRLLVHHLKAISLKGQIRLTPEMKHSMCKRCDSILVAGQTATYKIENQSREGKKPWADVLVISCNSCQAVKRFPVGAKRQRRRTDRKKPEGSAIPVT